MFGSAVKLPVALEDSLGGGARCAVELDLFDEFVKAYRAPFRIFHEPLLVARIEILGDCAEAGNVTVCLYAALCVKVHQDPSHIKKDCFYHRYKDK